MSGQTNSAPANAAKLRKDQKKRLAAAKAKQAQSIAAHTRKGTRHDTFTAARH
ncbi:hypothetical protein ACWGTO_07600 [Mesorhizobium sp. PL10]